MLYSVFSSGDGSLTSAAGSFLETFDGAPASPTPWKPANWDVTVHSRDVNTFTSLESMHAGHGSDCSAPPATHLVTAYDDAVFLCKDHVMTAITAEGYGAVYLTPNQLVDFSAGEAVVRFDMSTLRTSFRDWVDFWVMPFNDNVQLIGDIGAVDLNGYARNAVQIKMDMVNNVEVFRGHVIRNFNEQPVASDDGLALETLLTPSASVRTTFELRVSRTHMKFGIPALNAWWVDASFADLGWTSGVFTIGHHSYNPSKSDGCGPPVEVTSCTPNTWHWDNVSIAPSVPFTMLKADRRFVDASTSAQLNFSAPAPAGARLRFTGVGNNLGVSYDGGVTWQPPVIQAVETVRGEGGFNSYWTSIPAGTQAVRFRGTDWYGGPWMVRDASIWSSNTPAQVVPAPTTPPPVPTLAPTIAPTVAPTVAPTPSGLVVAPAPSPIVNPPINTLAGPPPTSTVVTATLPGLHSAWVDQTASPTLGPGELRVITLHFRNTGSETWRTGVAGGQVNLGVVGDSLEFADLGIAAGWLSGNRLATAAEQSVAQGQVGTFTFAVRGPTTPGSYRIDLRLVVDGVSWLEDQGVYVTITSDYGLHSSWVSQTPWPLLHSGELSGPITVTFRNTGDRAWVHAGEPIKLGVVGDGTSWGAAGVGWAEPNRPAVQSEPLVTPGALANFTFQVRAPGKAGVYVIPLRLVADGLTWLDDQGVFIQITVEP